MVEEATGLSRAAIPADPAPVHQAVTCDPEAPPPSGARGRRPHILCVDDEPDLVLLMTAALEAHGYRASGYLTPVEAMAALSADPARFDLVVTDEAMPGLSGLQVARAVRCLRPELPVVLASGFVDAATKSGAENAGVRVVLNKPYGLHELLAVVQSLVADPDQPPRPGDDGSVRRN